MPPRRTRRALGNAEKSAGAGALKIDDRLPFKEAAAWRDIAGTWLPLYGSFFEGGVSVEWHDFTLAHDMDWAGSFHPGSLEICLNFSALARLQDGEAVRELPAGSLAIYTTRDRAPRAIRVSGSWHRFLTIELSP